MEKIAIIGSREKYLADPAAVRKLVYDYVGALPTSIIVSGAAGGVDSYAAEAANNFGHVLVEYAANWRPGGIYDRSAGHKRNTLVIQQADRVVAFWDGASPGTANAIRQAEDMSKPVEIHIVNGAR